MKLFRLFDALGQAFAFTVPLAAIGGLLLLVLWLGGCNNPEVAIVEVADPNVEVLYDRAYVVPNAVWGGGRENGRFIIRRDKARKVLCYSEIYGDSVTLQCLPEPEK